VATENSEQSSGKQQSHKNGDLMGQDLKVAGLVQLRIFKKELGIFYKQLIQVVFEDPIDKDAAIALEKKVNELQLTVNDSINEVEISIESNNCNGANDK